MYSDISQLNIDHQQKVREVSSKRSIMWLDESSLHTTFHDTMCVRSYVAFKAPFIGPFSSLTSAAFIENVRHRSVKEWSSSLLGLQDSNQDHFDSASEERRLVHTDHVYY